MTKYCEFQTIGEVAKCSVCGFTMPASGQRIFRHCDSLTLLDKVRNFTKAAISHVSAGLPTCSDEEVTRRHDICLGCEHFVDNSCAKCGCPINRNKKFISKLAWADQSCPVGKWGPVTPAG